MAYKPACQIFFILPRRVVCASVRSDTSMAALVRAAAARRGRTEGWDMGKGGAGAGGAGETAAAPRFFAASPASARDRRRAPVRPPRVVEVEDVLHRLSHAAAVGQPRRAPRRSLAAARGKGTADAERREGIYIHISIYTYICVWRRRNRPPPSSK